MGILQQLQKALPRALLGAPSVEEGHGLTVARAVHEGFEGRLSLSDEEFI